MRARTCIDEKSIEVASTRAEFDAAIDAHARSLPKYGHVKFITDALARMDEVGVRCVGHAACYRRPHAYADVCAVVRIAPPSVRMSARLSRRARARGRAAYSALSDRF